MSTENVLLVVDLDTTVDPPAPLATFGPIVVAVSSTGTAAPGSAADLWADRATLTLSEEPTADRRMVHVASTTRALETIGHVIASNPIAAQTCDDVLRVNAGAVTTRQGLTTESLAYSTLQAGPEFARWLAGKGTCEWHRQDDAVLLDREENAMVIAFNRPDRHNAFSNELRAGLITGLQIALGDDSITTVTLTGRGPTFCSGGDLVEFGLLDDPSAAHLARTRHSPALLLDAVTERLGTGCRAIVRGAVLGSGIEMAAYCGAVHAHPDTVFGLPELSLGLIPGAGGTVSIPRRIGRWRTAYLSMTNERISTDTALAWGLIDAITDPNEWTR